MNSIPLVDLAPQYAEVVGPVQESFAEILASGAFVGGKAVAAFETEYADFVGVDHCVGVGNGTDALEFALRAVGVTAGDRVVIPANTFVATAEAVVRAGATPLLVDVDETYLLMDPAKVAEVVDDRVRAVVPVHLYGQVAPTELLAPHAGRLGAALVEDAAQVQGAVRFGRAAGGLGQVAATSFYPGKNLGAAGDAGAVLTDDAETARRVRLLGNHGSEQKYVHSDLGFNSRLDALQAVVLSAKLRRLADWNRARQVAAERYRQLLEGVPDVRVPEVMPGNQHVWHLFVVRVPARDDVLRRLNERGIGAGVHYPQPVHLTGGFRHLGYGSGDFPVSERAAGEILSLPIYPHITAAQQERVAEALAKALR